MSTKGRSSIENEALFARANSEWEAGKRKSAFKLFLQAANAGHASAKNSVGYFLDHGIGTRKSSAQAVIWYRRAARSGDLSALANMAISYRDRGDLRQAKAWFEKAIEAGDSGSAIDLAKLLLMSNKKINRDKAIQHLRAAVTSKYISQEDAREGRQILKKLT